MLASSISGPTGLAGLDTSWYEWMARFAGATPWLHGVMLVYTQAGLVLCGVLLLLAWRAARQLPAEAMVSALCGPVLLLVAYGLSNVVKVLVQEPRPCLGLPTVPTVATCEFATDYSFPSNHAVIAGASAVAVLLVHRRLGLIAVLVTVLMGLSRVYVGAHYPHDVIAGLVLGAAVAVAGVPARPVLAGPVAQLRRGRWTALLGPAPGSTASVSS